jgi:hemerythrin superfamily protein
MKQTHKTSDTNTEKKPLSHKDVVSLILEDHKPLKKLILILKDLEASMKEKRPAFKEFSSALTLHSKAEEESLYVFMKNIKDMRIEALEGDKEHSIADELIKEIEEISSGDDNELWESKVKVLAELVDHHIKEEESDILKQVKKTFDAHERAQIGEVYKQLLVEFS